MAGMAATGGAAGAADAGNPRPMNAKSGLVWFGEGGKLTAPGGHQAGRRTRCSRGGGRRSRMDLKRLRALLAAGKPQEVYEAVFKAYRELRSAKRVALAFGCTPKEWGRFLGECPRLREDRERALDEVGREEVRALRRQLGVLAEELVAVPEPRLPAMVPKPRKRASAGPPTRMALELEVAQVVPRGPLSKQSGRKL